MVVRFGYELIHIVKVSESEQTLTQKLWIRMSWTNQLMTWRPYRWGGVTDVRVDPDVVWKPDIFLQSDVGADISLGPDKYKTSVIVKHDGRHEWMVPTLFESSCILEVKR